MTGAAERNEEAGERSWSIDRRLPVGAFLALGLYAATGVWWAAHVEARLGTVEAFVAESRAMEPRLARLEERIEAMRETLSRIDRRLAEGWP